VLKGCKAVSRGEFAAVSCCAGQDGCCISAHPAVFPSCLRPAQLFISHTRKQAPGAVLCMLAPSSAYACCDSIRRSCGERPTITLSTTRPAAVHLPIDVSCLPTIGAYLQTTLARTYSHSAPLSHVTLQCLSAPHAVPSIPPPSVPTSLIKHVTIYLHLTHSATVSMTRRAPGAPGIVSNRLMSATRPRQPAS
jgi:hypothetical protein